MKTIADVSNDLFKKKAKYEKMLGSSIEAERNTAHKMIERIQGKLDELFNYQESRKPASAKKQTMAFGGWNHQFPDFLQQEDSFTNHLVPMSGNMAGNPPQTGLGGWDLIRNAFKSKNHYGGWYPFNRGQGQNAVDETQFIDPGFDVVADRGTTPRTLPQSPLPTGSPSAQPRSGAQIYHPSNHTPVKGPFTMPALAPSIDRSGIFSPNNRGVEQVGPQTRDIQARNINPDNIHHPNRSRDLNVDWNRMGQFGAGIAPYLADFASQRRTINRMQGPEEPIMNPLVHFNSALDVGAEVNEAQRMRRLREMNAMRYSPGSQQAMAEQGRGTAEYMRQRGGISQTKQNFAAQMQNQQAAMNAQISGSNVHNLNRHRRDVIDFENNRLAARQGSTTGLIQNIMNMMAEGRMRDHDKQRMKILMGRFPQPIQDELGSLLG